MDQFVKSKKVFIKLIIKLIKDIYLQGVNDCKNDDVAFEDGFDYDLRLRIETLINDYLIPNDLTALREQPATIKKSEDGNRFIELPEGEDFDIYSSINTIVSIVSNDFIVFFNDKEYIVDLFISEDPREEVEFRATCRHYHGDSYGMIGSEFNRCTCEDITKCKYAGSEFKCWDKTDPNPNDTDCIINFTNKDVDKTIFLKLS